ncbi:MAG: helix-turn-helix domain-containing protein [Bdellovibrionota bacterium]
METIGKRLRRLRKLRGLSLKEVGAAIGVPVSTYKEWEYGRAIQGEPYEKLAECLGVSLGELLTGNGIEARAQSLLLEIQEVSKKLCELENHLRSLF